MRARVSADATPRLRDSPGSCDKSRSPGCWQPKTGGNTGGLARAVKCVTLPLVARGQSHQLEIRVEFGSSVPEVSRRPASGSTCLLFTAEEAGNA